LYTCLGGVAGRKCLSSGEWNCCQSEGSGCCDEMNHDGERLLQVVCVLEKCRSRKWRFLKTMHFQNAAVDNGENVKLIDERQGIERRRQ
jgi:hypothetical protein